MANETSHPAWDDARRAALIAQILSGELTLQGACERHGLSAEAVRDWVPVFRDRTLKALDEELLRTFLVQGVNAERVGSAAYSGGLTDIPLPDLLQTLQMGRKDVVITVTHGGERSYIWCAGGDIVDAECARLRGEPAMYRILSFTHGQVFADFRFEPRKRTIHVSGNMLLLEAARHNDESVRLLERLDGSRSIYRPAAGAMAVQASPAEREVLDLCDGERAVRDVLGASELADLDTLSAMASLAERGYLLRDGTSPIPSAFSSESSVANETPSALIYTPGAPSWGEARPSRRHGTPLLVGLGVLLGILLAVGGAALTRQVSWRSGGFAWPRASFVLDTTTSPPGAQLWLDGERAGEGHLRRELPRDGTVHRLDVVAEGHLPTSLLFVDTAPFSSILLERLPPGPPPPTP